MNILPPYNFTFRGDEYLFTTDNGVFYSVTFSDAAYYFVDFPDYLSISEFSIKVLQVGESISPPSDKRVEATIVAILKAFFSVHTNSIIYVCDNLDNRHHARHRKFDTWFRQNQDATLEKFDNHFDIEGVEILASLIIHAANPYKTDIIRRFMNQPDELGK